MAAVLADQSTADPVQRTEYLWPSNVKNWDYWQSVQTQWRVGGAGSATGLDYAGVCADLSITHGLSGKSLRKALVCIKAAERATLEVHAEHARSQSDKSPH